jgi:hypothetical protein
MAYFPDTRGRKGHSLLLAPLLAFLAAAIIAACYIGYVLWPRWPGGPVSLEAPEIPSVIGGDMFNIPPAAIRRAVQRKPGTQERIDLAYLWPSLTPAELAAKQDTTTSADPNERLFLTIADGRDAMAPESRIESIYPRYLAQPANGPAEGLSLRAFRDGTPYQGEDLIASDAEASEFTARCSRTGVGNTGMCLLERRIGCADVTELFSRDWLDDWKNVRDGINRVLARLHP